MLRKDDTPVKKVVDAHRPQKHSGEGAKNLAKLVPQKIPPKRSQSQRAVGAGPEKEFSKPSTSPDPDSYAM